MGYGRQSLDACEIDCRLQTPIQIVKSCCECTCTYMYDYLCFFVGGSEFSFFMLLQKTLWRCQHECMS